MPTSSPLDSNITLDEFANSGLYGVVWKGRQLKPTRTIAVKLINPEYGMPFNAIEHANGLVKAGPHPNIVTVYQVTKVRHPETQATADAVVMEWLEGISLGARLGSESLLSVDEAKSICEGVLGGISHLHEHGVTHSDLHIGNVILTQHGPRIIDIDYSSSLSLAQLTTLDRKLRIQSDVSQVAAIVGMVIRKTTIDQSFYNQNESVLRSTNKMSQISDFLASAFSAETATQLSSPKTSPGGQLLAEQVQIAIQDRRKYSLRMMVMRSAGEVSRELCDDRFSATGQVNNELLRGRVEDYRSVIAPILPSLASLGFWGGRLPDTILLEAIDRIANAHEKNPMESGITAYLGLRRYPVATCLYAAGIGAIARSNFRSLFRILRDTVYYEHGRTKRKLWTEIAFWAAENRELWNKHVLGRDNYFPVSDVLEQNLRDPLAEIIPSDLRFVEAFDRFEFFASLEHFLTNGRALGVSFLWRRQGRRSDTNFFDEIKTEATNAGPAWLPLRAGLLQGTGRTDALKLLDDFGESIQEVMQSYRVW